MAYYRSWPFDDYHRYQRPAALIASRNGGGKIDDLLDWLQPPALQDGLSAADVATLRAFGINTRG